MVKIKICGITNEEDAQMAVSLGVDALGFVFYKESPRYIMPSVARGIINRLAPFVTTVGVFVDEDIEKVKSIVNFCGLDVVQLHGNEPPFYCEKLETKIIKAFRVKNSAVLGTIKNYKKISAILLDTYDEQMPGGTGRSFDLRLAIKAKELEFPLIISGGLSRTNVKKVIKKVMPYAVDVSSGVEAFPGKKDFNKMADFVKVVRSISFK